MHNSANAFNANNLDTQKGRNGVFYAMLFYYNKKKGKANILEEIKNSLLSTLFLRARVQRALR